MVESSILIPGTPDHTKPLPPITIARNLSSVPAPFDALDGVRKPYARIDLKEMKPTPRIEPAQPPTELPKPTTNLLVISYGSLADPAEIARQTERGMQRAAQYGKLLGFLTHHDERIQEGVKRFSYSISYENNEGRRIREDYEADPYYIGFLKKIAASFYADELRQDPLTAELAKDVLAQLIPSEEAAVAEAENIILEAMRANSQVQEAEIKYKEINCQTAEQAPTPIRKARKNAIEKSVQAEPNKQRAARFSKKAILEAVEYMLAIDRPSPSSTEWLEKLWERPF